VLVYLDCEVLGNSPPEEIFGQFAGEIASTLSDMGQAPEPALESAINRPTRLSFESAVRKLNQRGLRIIMILDEFERISTNSSLDVNFFNALRSAAGRYQLAFITASARPLIELTYSERSQDILSSPFFNIFAPMFLGTLAPDDARALIMQPSGGVFSKEMVEFLHELGGGHALTLQVACFHAFDNPNDPQAVERDTMREMDAHFKYYWHNLTPLEQDTLRRAGEAAARAHTDTTLRAALRDLVQKCLLEPTGSGYTYPSRAWAEFVAAQAQPEVTPQTIYISRVGVGLLTGSQVGSYEVHELLGRGGMAEVYKGRHTRLDRTVAIKVLSSNIASDTDFRRRFEREARSVAVLKHPNIVGVYDFGDTDGVCYMVMEYVPGQTLAQFLRQSGALPLDQAYQLLRDLASALDYAHAQGLVHRDVKPSNVMLEPVTSTGANTLGFRAVLTDFGIAKLLSSSQGTKTEGLTGTIDYMAPEQIRVSGDLDGRADIYALGVVAYQVLTGELPFEGDNPANVMMKHLQEPPPDPRRLLPELPARVASAILRAMAKHPADRFGTAGAFVEVFA
jgi:tRNA A-37 threonylcarbamoyl transferase component Bud32